MEAAKTLVVPITSDKGLCGGINSTVVKYTKVIDGVCGDMGSTSSLYVMGEKGRAQLARGATQNKLVGVLVDVAKPKDGITFASASLIADSLLGTGFEKLQLIYNRFQSVISFKPTVATLLSSAALEASGEAAGGLPFDQYESEGPDRAEFLLDLSEFHLAATLYNALLENSTSELGSRMQSMENSTKNAQEMLSKLTLYYNRTRQAAITTELIEIISGAVSALALRGSLLARADTHAHPFSFAGGARGLSGGRLCRCMRGEGHGDYEAQPSEKSARETQTARVGAARRSSVRRLSAKAR